MSGPDVTLRLAGQPAGEPGADLAGLLGLVARGDESAFEAAYEQIARPVYGLVRKVVRDPAQTEEVAQEVLLEVWRTATRFTLPGHDPAQLIRQHQPTAGTARQAQPASSRAPARARPGAK